jgi:plasmid maintenance system antidote protein VapI
MISFDEDNTVFGSTISGEILLGEFLKPLGVSQYRLAKDIRIAARRTTKSSTRNVRLLRTRRFD